MFLRIPRCSQPFRQLALAGVLCAVAACDSGGSGMSGNPFAEIDSDQDVNGDIDGAEELEVSDNLLFNSGFESGLSDWYDCGATPAVHSANANTGNGAAELIGVTCLYQENTLTQQQGAARIRCRALSGDNRYTGMTLGFNDSAFNSLGSHNIEVTSTSYAPIELSAPIPANAEYAAVSFYSEGSAFFDDCELVQLQ